MKTSKILISIIIILVVSQIYCIYELNKFKSTVEDKSAAINASYIPSKQADDIDAGDVYYSEIRTKRYPRNSVGNALNNLANNLSDFDSRLSDIESYLNK